jgi:aromatic amino acid transport protein AroP
MIVFGAWLLASGNGGPQASIGNLWEQGGFMPHGIEGLVMAMAVIMFSFGGLEMVGITAAEAADPRRSIPKATNQVVYRILIFYIGSLTVLLSLYPWDKVVEGGSPFVMIFHALNSNLVATLLNVVVLTAALSVYNSGVYANSRMLFGLATQGNAPKALTRVNKRGVPVLSIALSALVTSVGVLINYVMPGKAFELLMALVVSTLVINWVMICLAHLRFRAAKNRQGVIPIFKALWYPFGNYLCLVFLSLILVIMYFSEGIRISVLLMPVWILLLWTGFMLTRRKGAKVRR